MTGRLRSSSRKSSQLLTGAAGSAAGLLAIAALVFSVSGRAHAAAQPAAPAPLPARTIVAAAVKRAAAEKKVVLVEFGASWCTWCRSFDAFVHAPETSRVLGDNFVIVNLTVQERGENKALENPGGEEVLTEWDGFDAGLPFYVFLNGTGEKIADSNVMRDGSNVGFPGNAEELRLFVGLLEATAPHLTTSGRRALTSYLTAVVKP